MLKKRWSLAFILLGIGLITSWISSIDAEVKLIPTWIKNTAKFWANDQISDREFLNALQFLVDKGVLVIPTEESKNITVQSPPSPQLSKMEFQQLKEIEYEKTAIPVGTSITQGSFKITLEKIGVYKYLTFGNEEKEGFRADFMIENISPKLEFNPSNIILVDDKNKQHKKSSFVNSTLGVEQLLPKATQEGYVVFEGFKGDSSIISIIIEQYDFPYNNIWKWDIKLEK